jgi:hypothetical protein
MAGDDARAEQPQPARLLYQPELDRVPIEPRQLMQRAELQAAQAAHAIGLHIIGIDRVGEHRHMAEHVVENVRLLKIIELIRPTDEIARDEAAIGEMVEKDLVRHQPRYRDHAPAGQRAEPLGQFLEIRNARPGQPQDIEPAQIGLARPAAKLCGLTGEQSIPGAMILRAIMRPVLRDGPVGRGALGRRLVDVQTLHGRDCSTALARGKISDFPQRHQSTGPGRPLTPSAPRRTIVDQINPGESRHVRQ